jgi:hypothetical protein
LYDVGGRLSYSVGGVNFSVPLLPDTITVKPNPSLVVHYFHEKYVRGDDPLTPETEPIIPFTLAVMVMNTGYGIARALKVSGNKGTEKLTPPTLYDSLPPTSYRVSSSGAALE